MKRNFLAASALVTILTSWSGLSWANTASTGSESNPMKQVEAVMQKSHQLQNQQRQKSAYNAVVSKAQAKYMDSVLQSTKSTAKQELVGAGSPSQNTPKASVPAASTTSTPAAPTADLQAQLSKLKQSNLVFQQQAGQRIAGLVEKDVQLEAKLSQLGQVLSMLSQEVNQLGAQIKKAQTALGSDAPASKSAPIKMTGEASQWTQYTQYGIFGLLVLVVILLLFRRGSGSKPLQTSSDQFDTKNSDDIKDEYDFMGSDEATPAKLDLARAYLAMEDYKAAKKVLDQVMKTGDDKQRTEARKMLSKIPK